MHARQALYQLSNLPGSKFHLEFCVAKGLNVGVSIPEPGVLSSCQSSPQILSALNLTDVNSMTTVTQEFSVARALQQGGPNGFHVPSSVPR